MRGASPLAFAACSLLVFPVLWVGFLPVRAQLFTLTFLAIQIWLQELEYAILGGLHSGPNVLVDARDLAELGVEAMMTEVLAALGLEADAVAWMQDSSAPAEAKVLAEHALAYHAVRESGV